MTWMSLHEDSIRGREAQRAQREAQREEEARREAEWARQEVRRRAVDRSVRRLDRGIGEDDRRAIKERALVSVQTYLNDEYDDEYDDSFDDLVAASGDGVTEVEGAGPPRGGRGGGGAGPSRLGEGAGPAAAPRPGRAPAAGGRAKPLYVADGRVYNYRREGAVAVGSQAEADALVRAQTEFIGGMPEGGNHAIFAAANEAREAAAAAAAAEGGGGGGGGRGGAGGRGGGPNFKRKEQNKAKVGNHHRKDRARKKAGQGML